MNRLSSRALWLLAQAGLGVLYFVLLLGVLWLWKALGFLPEEYVFVPVMVVAFLVLGIAEVVKKAINRRYSE